MFRNCSEKITLWDHQVKMIHRCKEIEATYPVGLMTDPPGTGKTHVTISLIADDIPDPDFPRKPSLIVVTDNIYRQWWDSLMMYPKLSCSRFTNYSEITGLYFESGILREYDVLLTTPTYYNTIAQIITSERLPIRRLIIDEIDSVSGIMQNTLNTDQIWFISGSFQEELTGCYRPKIQRYQPLRQITCCLDSDEYRILKELPEPCYQTHQCKNIYLDLILDGIITSEERACLDALSFDDLPTEHVSSRNIQDFNVAVKRLRAEMDARRQQHQSKLEAIDISLSQLRKDLLDLSYTDKERETFQEQFTILSSEKRRVGILSTENQDKIDKISQRLRDSKLCMICQEALTKNTKICATTCCQSIYCFECISTWLVTNNHDSCPYCRATVCMDLLGKKSVSNLESSQVVLLCDVVEHERILQGETEVLLAERARHADELVQLDEGLRHQEKKLQGEYQSKLDSQLIDNQKRYQWVKQWQVEYEKSTRDQSSKLDTLRKILTAISDQDRMIIFSNYSQTFSQICGILQDMSILYVTLDGGNMRDLEISLDKYRTGVVQIMMADYSMHGCGINLECTSKIILVHRVDEVTRLQLIARAQRPGRTGQLEIHQLLHRNEIIR